jgi:hypothetical protein
MISITVGGKCGKIMHVFDYLLLQMFFLIPVNFVRGSYTLIIRDKRSIYFDGDVANGDYEVSLNNMCHASHRLQEYSLETGLATVIDGSDILKVSIEQLKDLKFQVGSVYQFIGELLIQPDNKVCACQGLVKACLPDFLLQTHLDS